MRQGPPRNGQRKPAQAQGGAAVPGGALWVGDPVPAYRDAEAQRSRVRMEGCKYRLVTSEHYGTLEDLTHAVSEYFRTCSIRLDIYKFLYCCVRGRNFQ